MWDVFIRYMFMILHFWWVQMYVCVLHTEGSFWTSEKYVMWRSRLTHCLQVCLWKMIESLYLLGSDGVKQQKIGYGHLPFTICGDKCMYDNNILIHGCMGAFVPHVFSCEYVHTYQYIFRSASILGNEHFVYLCIVECLHEYALHFV